MRLQAKRLYMNCRDVDHSYDDLDHKGGKQLEDLIDEAKKDFAIPLYCFYNFYFPTKNSYSKLNINAEEEGWRYAYASDVLKERKKDSIAYKNLGKIDPLTNSMYMLAKSAENYSKGILDEYVSKSIDVNKEDLCREEIPDYVFDKLEDYEFPDNSFLKHKDWFPGIKGLRKKIRRKEGKDI